MIERKYSVSEIAKMRDAVTAIERLKRDGPAITPPAAAEIESVLQTYMLNGTEPEELQAEAETRRKAKDAHNAEFRRYLREVA